MTIHQSLLGLAGLVMVAASSSAWAGDYAELIRRSPGLLAYYRCETPARDQPDSSQSPRNALLQGPEAAGVPSPFADLGTALRFQPGNHLEVLPLGQHSAGTLEFWLRLKALPSQGIAGLYANHVWRTGAWHLNLYPGGDVELAINGIGRFPHSPTETVPLDQWVHLVATYDSDTSELRLFANGQLLLDELVQTPVPLNLTEALIGAWKPGDIVRPLNAEMDEIAIYSVALSPAQVRRHYQTAKGVSEVPVDYAHTIRPLLAKHCLDCHGPELQEAGLRLDIRDSALRGGESGEPALAPFTAERSHLYELVTSQDRERRMPPDGSALSETELTLIRNWIDQGAIWPDEYAGKWEEKPVTTDHWSFQPLGSATPPTIVTEFAQTGNAIDRLIAAKLQEKGLTPSPPAEKRILIRRLYLDNHGLPPTPAEVEQFLTDESPTAWEALVDRVLQSPRFAERWASHWLDVIRYGDTHGFEVNTPRDHAWPYRDYVIQSFHTDKPYHQFVREQIAGDQLGVDAATGFLVAAPAVMPGQVGKDVASMRQARSDELHEMIVTVGSGVLGLTIGCARCHNHKFDPVSQADYYELQAIFAGVQYRDRPLKPEQAAALRLSNEAPLATTIYGGQFTAAPAVHRLYRGDPMQRRERMAPDIPAVFGTLGLETSSSEAERRLKLADWLVSADNPLTPRVIANRLWQHHFGVGLVSTPSDFGIMGRPPTHPELLDYLATELIDSNWSLKALHRTILLSNTYRQSSTPRTDALSKDASCSYLWRYPPWRLEMEPIRDSILAVSGTLDLTMGGPGFMVFEPNSNYVRVYDPKTEWGPAEWRRMIYAHRVRMAQDGVFGAFDCPDAGQPAPKRSRSTTALQALNLLNSTFVTQQSELFAERLKREAGTEPAAQIELLYQLTYQRPPTDPESTRAIAFAAEYGLSALCRAVVNSNEFLFVP